MTHRGRTAVPGRRPGAPAGGLARRAGGGYLARAIRTAATDVVALEHLDTDAEVSR